MRINYFISIFIMNLIFVGCATTQTTSSLKPKVEFKAHYDIAENATTKKCPLQKDIQNEKSWKVLAEYANACTSQLNWSTLELVAERLNQVEPDAPWGAYYLSISAEKRQFLERALWMADLSLKKSSQIGLLRYQRARVLWLLDFQKESIQEVRKALDLDPRIKDGFVFLGQIQMKQQSYSESVKSFEAALKLDSDHKEALLGLSLAFVELQKAQEALQYISAGKSYYSKTAEFRVLEAYVYESLLKQFDVALEKYKEIRTMNVKKQFDSQLKFNVDEKITALEKSVKNATPKMAQKE